MKALSPRQQTSLEGLSPDKNVHEVTVLLMGVRFSTTQFQTVFSDSCITLHAGNSAVVRSNFSPTQTRAFSFRADNLAKDTGLVAEWGSQHPSADAKPQPLLTKGP